MNAAVPDPRFREQLAEDIRDLEGGQYVWDALHQLAEQWAAVERHEEADLLLSLLARAAEVEARVQAAANQRAVEELRAAAVEARRFVVWPYGYDLAAKLDDRAAALASPAPAPRAEEGQADAMPEGWIDADWTHYS